MLDHASMCRKIGAGSPVLQRMSTMRNAVAEGIGARTKPSGEQYAEAMLLLGQNPNGELSCVYCAGRPATAWDHLHPSAVNSLPTGVGAYLGNLVPTCDPCNNNKNNTDWWGSLLLRRRVPAAGAPDDAIDGVFDMIERLAYYEWFYALPHLGYEELRSLLPKQVAELEREMDELLAAAERIDALTRELRKAQHAHAGLPAPASRRTRRSPSGTSRPVELPAFVVIKSVSFRRDLMARHYAERVLGHAEPPVPAKQVVGPPTLLPNCPLPAATDCPGHGSHRTVAPVPPDRRAPRPQDPRQ